MARQQPIELFMPPNMLKAKAGHGGFDNTALKRAEAAMENLKGEFLSWAGEDVKALVAAREAFARTGDPAAREALTRRAHDMKGQAATFDFPLMGRVAASLSRLLGETRADQPLPPGLVDAHVAAIQVIYREKISAPDNALALTLCAELDARVKQALG
jgi:hypothetical protein